MSKHKIAVIMPARNTGAFITESIMSILKQIDCEVVLYVADDNSTDDTARKIRSLAVNEPRIKAFFFKKRMGVANLRRFLIEKIIETEKDIELIAFQDSDDIALPTRLAKQANYLLTRHKVGIVGCHMQCFGLSDEIIHRCDNNALLKRNISRDNPVLGPTAMFRKAAYAGLTCLPSGEDYDFSLRIGRKWELGNIQEILMNYRVHHGSYSRSRYAVANACSFVHYLTNCWYYEVRTKDILNNLFRLACLLIPPKIYFRLRAFKRRIFKK